MRAIWNGTVLAESDQTVVVEGRHYFPPDSVHWEHFEESDKSTTCPWKGRASYYSVVAGEELAARLDLPDGQPVAFALFAHCFTCTNDMAAATLISRGLVAQGFGVLRFDFTGLGASGGEFANTTFSSNVEDLVRAAAMLSDRYRAPALLVGHSLGGAAVLAPAPSIPEVGAVATIGAPFDPGHITHLFPPHTLAELEHAGEADVQLAGRTFRVRRQLLDDANAQNLTHTLARLGRALLVFHSPVDEIVDVDNARRIYEAARHPKSFVSLDRAHQRHRPTLRRRHRHRHRLGARCPGPDDPSRAASLHRRRTTRHRRRPRPDALRPAARRARHLHIDDTAHVRRPTRLAPRAGDRSTPPRPGPRR